MQPSETSLPTSTPPATKVVATKVVAANAPTATPTPVFHVCSPLEGITLEELKQPDLLKNPFQQPRPGMDDGHHGADFAYWTRGERKTMQGLPVYSVLPGKVASVILNRIPYGNAVIVETPLQDLPLTWLEALQLPSPEPTVQPAASLICPADQANYATGSRRSLYLLYAHLDQPSALAAGQSIGCGDTIGAVGTTGKSVNYHLHLESRVGPAGMVFPSMAFYDTAATQAEMSAYCTWRVSGLLQMFDPLKLFP